MKKTLALLLVFLLCLALLPVSAAEQESAAPSAARGIQNSITIDDDPDDGYEGDYVVIYNPALDYLDAATTGDLTGRIETEISPSVAKDVQTADDDLPGDRIDVDAALMDAFNAMEEVPAYEPERMSFTVGSVRKFQIYEAYSPTGNAEVEFKCIHVGEHCYIWTPTVGGNAYPLDEIDPSFAKIAADEFDSKYDLMQSSFGKHNDLTDGDGKLHMLYYNIDDGWQPGRGYVAGFFYAYDLRLNGLPMLNIDTYPGVVYTNASGQTSTRLERTFNTMVHEYQHLINFSNTRGMHAWLNECFSAAAEEICYPGSSVIPRVKAWENRNEGDWRTWPKEFAYQPDYNLHNGYSMYDWSNNLSDVLALYAQVSFFSQYLFTRFGNTIYQRISGVYEGSEVDAITQATGIDCAALVRDFRVAVTANAAPDQYGGIYGFETQDSFDPEKNDGMPNPWVQLSPIVYTGSSCVLKGGGAITVKPVGGVYDPPIDADPDLIYIGVKFASPYTVTAIANDDALGTLSVDGTKITASPAEGYYVSGYEIVSGSATASIRRNVVRVTPQSDCTVRIIFSPKPECTVRLLASGTGEGNLTALLYDDVTLPDAVSVNPDEWTFTGWTETRLNGETERAPVLFAPGAAYTVNGNATLYAVYTRVAVNGGESFCELISEPQADWSGTYAISYRAENTATVPMYLMKGVAVDEDGAGIETDNNAAWIRETGAKQKGTTLTKVTDEFLFMLEPHGEYYSIRSVGTGDYVGISVAMLSGFRDYAPGECDWTPGTGANAGGARIAAGGLFPTLSFSDKDEMFRADRRTAKEGADVRFWKQGFLDATYYTTDPVAGEPLPEFDGTVEWNAEDVAFKGETAYVVANGQAQTPRFDVLAADGSVVDPSNYTFEYRENVNAGTAYVIITFKDTYSGTAQGWFKIYLPATDYTTVENRDDGIYMEWHAVPGAAGYVIYRRAWSSTTNGWTDFVRWNNTTDLNWTDTKVYAGTRYQYGIKAYFERRVDPVSGAEIGGNVGDNFNLGQVGPLKTAVRITTRVLNSVTAGSAQLTVRWTPSKNFTGYEVRCATDAAFTQNVRTVKIADAKTAETVIRDLDHGTTYYVQVRSYQVFEGMTYFGGWSNALSCEIN